MYDFENASVALAGSAVLLVSFVVAILATPFARGFANRFRAIDAPKELGIHQRPVPRTGGLAIFTGWAAAMVVALVAGGSIESPRAPLIGIVAAGCLIFVLGLLDDTGGLTPVARLVGETVAASVLILSGVIFAPGWPTWLWLPVSLLWFVGLANAINFLDGMDGLAAGVVAVGASFLGALAAMRGDPSTVILAAAVLGSCLAFLRSNVYPASIFMGDSGSLFLGLQVAVLGALVMREASGPNWLIAPIIALGLPLLDATGAVVRRIRSGRSLFLGDRRHTYDLLLARGMSHTGTVRTTWLVSAALGSLAIGLALQPWGIGPAVAVLALFLLSSVSAAALGLFSSAG